MKRKAEDQDAPCPSAKRQHHEETRGEENARLRETLGHAFVEIRRLRVLVAALDRNLSDVRRIFAEQLHVQEVGMFTVTPVVPCVPA
jgi:hypothetical protein